MKLVRVLVIYCFFCFSPWALAQSKIVLAKSAEVSESEYLAFVQTHAQYISPVDQFRRQAASNNSVHLLARRLQSAQKSFLNEPTAIASKKFVLVAELAHNNDWNQVQRQAIHYAHLRRAMLAEAKAEKNLWLTKAFVYAPDLSPDKKLFPPPLVQQYKAVQETLKWFNWDLSFLHSHYSSLFINGREFHLKHRPPLKLPQGVIRVTLVSNHLKPISKVMNSLDLIGWNPTSQAIVRGNCQMPLLNPSIKQNVHGYFGPDCVKQLTAQPSPAPNELPSPLSTKMANLQPPRKTTTKLKSHWLWWATAGVVATLVVNQQAKQPPGRPSPTTKEGF